MRVTRALLLASALFFAGCNAADLFGASGKNIPRPPPKQCAKDSDCSADRHEVCRVADGSGAPTIATGAPTTFDGICVIPAGASSNQVFLEIRPGSENTPATQLGPVRLSDGQNQQLVLPPAVTVNGTVVYHQVNPISAPAPVKQAKLKFRIAPLIPDRPMSFDATTLADDAATAGHFTRLLPGGEFSLFVVPPPVQNIPAPIEQPYDGTRDARTLAGDVQVFEISDPSNLVLFSGRATVKHDGQVVPAANVQVWAMSADSMPDRPTGWKGLGGKPLAQPVGTDADGRFTLWLPRLPDSGDPYRVRLQFGPLTPDQPFPSFVDPTIFTVDNSGARPAQAPPSATVDSPVDVFGTVRHSRTLRGVPHARVTFRTTDDSPISYAVTVLADDQGRYHARLFPATYAGLAALPPPDDGTDEGRDTASIGLCPPETTGTAGFVPDGSGSLDFQCESASALTGTVRRRSGNAPIGSVSVEAIRQKDALVADELHFHAQADADGAFGLLVPRGSYAVVLTPSPDARLPIKRVDVGSTDSISGQLLEIELDEPFELFGQLFSGDTSRPLAASIEAYTVNGDGTSSLVGQGASKDDGSYSIVLPASAN